MLATRFASLAFGLVVSSLAVVGCSSSSSNTSSSQASSRDEAASVTCDRYAACNEIGPGKTYESADQCSVKQKANWDSLWPPQDCDGKIDQDAYNVCLDTLRAAECGNQLDVANIIFNKCPKSKVCAGTAK